MFRIAVTISLCLSVSFADAAPLVMNSRLKSEEDGYYVEQLPSASDVGAHLVCLWEGNGLAEQFGSLAVEDITAVESINMHNAVLTIELVLVTSIVVVGAITGLSTLRDALVTELDDLSIPSIGLALAEGQSPGFYFEGTLDQLAIEPLDSGLALVTLTGGLTTFDPPVGADGFTAPMRVSLTPFIVPEPAGLPLFVLMIMTALGASRGGRFRPSGDRRRV